MQRVTAHFSGDIYLALDRPIAGVEKLAAPATFETAFRRSLAQTFTPRFSDSDSSLAASGSYRQARSQPIAVLSEYAPEAFSVLEGRLAAGFARPALTRNSLQPCNATRPPSRYRLTPAERTGCAPYPCTRSNHDDSHR